nr:minor coat protein [Grapevine leafroll-associated virus 13]
MTTETPRSFGRLEIPPEESVAARRAFQISSDGASLAGYPHSNGYVDIIRGWKLGVANSTVNITTNFTRTMENLPDSAVSARIMIILPTPLVDGGIFSKIVIQAKDVNGVYTAGTYNASMERASVDSKGVASSGTTMGHSGGLVVFFCYATLGGAYKMTLQETTTGLRNVYVLEVFRLAVDPREVTRRTFEVLKELPIMFHKCYLDSVPKTPQQMNVSSIFTRRDVYLSDPVEEPAVTPPDSSGNRRLEGASQRKEPEIPESVQRLEDVVVTYSNVMDVINSGVNKGRYYDDKITKLSLVDFTPPQYMDIDDARKVSESILEYIRHRYGGSSEVFEMMGLLALIQCAVTYSTVQDAKLDDRAGVEIKHAGESHIFKYNDFIQVINTTETSRDYSNKLRKYMRWWSATTISLVKTGVIKPNYATQASHGVVKAYIPYCFDFVALDSRYNTKDEKIAAGLAKYVAIKNKLRYNPSSNDENLHNTIELGVLH